MRSAAVDAMTRVLLLSAAHQAAPVLPLAAPRGRPWGDVSRALLCAAAAAGPCTVRELAERACVGYASARYTSSRLVSRGELVALHEGRPMVLAVSADLRSFWAEANLKGAEP
jgi:hypothetical protein